MKKYILLLFCFIPFISFSQLTENFSDGNFTANPTWVGDGSQFIINADQQLQLNSSGSATSYLAIPAAVATLDSTEWQCYINLDFSPSSQNYGRVYLVSDQSNLAGPLNGYFLQFGETSSVDAIELFKQTGTALTSVARGINGFVANPFAITVKVTRNNTGLWKIYADAAAGNSYLLQASGTDATYNSSAFSGVVCTYTSSNATSFYFDDFYLGSFILDHIPPAVSTVMVIDQTSVDVIFNEGLEQLSAETISNYTVAGNAITSAILTSANTVHLTFATNFVSGATNTLSVLGVKDLSDNPITTTSTAEFTYYTVSAASFSDIIINEVLYSPFNTDDGSEFIEIYNKSQKVIDMSSLRVAKVELSDTTLISPVPVTMVPYLLLPGKYLVLTKNADGVKKYYNTPDPDAIINVASFPSLTDGGDEIAIVNASLTRIDQFRYSQDYQFPLLNDDHGVSLERISFNRPTQDSSNWHSAAETVGFATPAYENSQHTEIVDDGSEVSVEPEIFSPDNDGASDALNVRYHFDAPGYTANLKVFDSKGRLIVHLVKNQLLGIDGSFIWDGITDNNEKAKVGIYVAYLEVFRVDGSIKKFKKPFVLASKL